MVRLIGKIMILETASVIATNLDDVRKDVDLQDYLHSVLIDRKRVYLFGDNFTSKEYKKLVHLDTLKVAVDVDAKQGYFVFGEDAEKGQAEKGKLKPSKEVTGTDEQTNIVGFSLNNNDIDQYTDISVSSVDETGKPRKNDKEVYIQEILNNQAEIIQKEEKQLAKKNDTALITMSKAMASNTLVQDKYNFYGTLYDPNNALLGRIDIDTLLYMQTRSGDGSSTYDYFTLKPAAQLTNYNDGHARKLYTNLDIPYDTDEIQSWSPQGDSSRVSWNVTLSWQYTLGYTITLSDTASLDDQGSLYYDYARWILTDDSLNGDVWRPAAGWASSGTYAWADFTGKGTFWFGTSDQYPADASKTVPIRYDD